MRVPVFISSKMAELHDDRIALAAVIDDTEGLEAVFAEDWSPRRATPEEAYVADAMRCPIYVGLFWRVYSEATEREYQTACANTETEILLYVRDSAEQERDDRLRALLAGFNSSHVCSKYSGTRDLCNKAPKHLRDAITRMVTRLHRLGAGTRSSDGGSAKRLQRLLSSWGLNAVPNDVSNALELAAARLKFV
jgi:hypothetical protein